MPISIPAVFHDEDRLPTWPPTTHLDPRQPLVEISLDRIRGCYNGPVPSLASLTIHCPAGVTSHDVARRLGITPSRTRDRGEPPLDTKGASTQTSWTLSSSQAPEEGTTGAEGCRRGARAAEALRRAHRTIDGGLPCIS